MDHTILASLCHLLDPGGEGESVEYATQGVYWESGSLRRRGSRKVSPSRSDDYMYDRSSNHVISAFRLVARWPSCEGRRAGILYCGYTSTDPWKKNNYHKNRWFCIKRTWNSEKFFLICSWGLTHWLAMYYFLLAWHRHGQPSPPSPSSFGVGRTLQTFHVTSTAQSEWPWYPSAISRPPLASVSREP